MTAARNELATFVFIQVSQLPRGLGPSRWFVPRVIAVNDMRFLEGISYDNGPIKFRNSSLTVSRIRITILDISKKSRS